MISVQYSEDNNDSLMKDIEAFLHAKGARIHSDDEEDATLMEEGENGIVMENAPQQIMLNGNDCQNSYDTWSSDGENEHESRNRKKSAGSRKNVHFRYCT